MALAVDPSTLFGATYNKDQWPTPSASYGDTNLILQVNSIYRSCSPRLRIPEVDPIPAAHHCSTIVLQPRTDQPSCTSRNCQNYDDKQMWYVDPTENLIRQVLPIYGSLLLISEIIAAVDP